MISFELLDRQLMVGLSVLLVQTLPKRRHLQTRSCRAEALEQSIERVVHHFLVARLRQRPRRVARRDVLVPIELVADRRAQQSQRCARTLQLFARAVDVGFAAFELFNGAAEVAQEDLAGLLHRSIGRDERLQRAVGHDRS